MTGMVIMLRALKRRIAVIIAGVVTMFAFDIFTLSIEDNWKFIAIAPSVLIYPRHLADAGGHFLTLAVTRSRSLGAFPYDLCCDCFIGTDTP